jgi:hypothetical protein
MYLKLVCSSRDVSVIAAKLHQTLMIPAASDINTLDPESVNNDIVHGVATLQMSIQEFDEHLCETNLADLDRAAWQLPVNLEVYNAWRSCMSFVFWLMLAGCH